MHHLHMVDLTGSNCLISCMNVRIRGSKLGANAPGSSAANVWHWKQRPKVPHELIHVMGMRPGQSGNEAGGMGMGLGWHGYGGERGQLR